VWDILILVQLAFWTFNWNFERTNILIILAAIWSLLLHGKDMSYLFMFRWTSSDRKYLFECRSFWRVHLQEFWHMLEIFQNIENKTISTSQSMLVKYLTILECTTTCLLYNRPQINHLTKLILSQFYYWFKPLVAILIE